MMKRRLRHGYSNQNLNEKVYRTSLQVVGTKSIFQLQWRFDAVAPTRTSECLLVIVFIDLSLKP